MGKPVNKPPIDAAKDDSPSYIDPGYELLEKVTERKHAIPEAIAD